MTVHLSLFKASAFITGKCLRWFVVTTAYDLRLLCDGLSLFDTFSSVFYPMPVSHCLTCTD